MQIRICESTQALALFESLAKQRLERNIISYGAAMTACERAEEWQLALSLLDELHSAKLQGNLVTYNTCISACEKAGEWEAALGLFQEILEHLQADLDVISYSSAASACEKASQWERAVELLRHLRHHSLQENVITCNAVISACEKAGRWQMAWEVLREMKRERLRATVVTFCAAISACEKGGRWRQSLEIFGELQCEALQQMSVSPCFASCRCCGDSREYQERVSYHARRFATSKCSREVLQRYDLRLQKADNLELQKCTFHVASWVSELLVDSKKAQKSPSDLSPVVLLIRYLERLKGSKPLCNQLLQLLKTLAPCSSNEEMPWQALAAHLSELVPDSTDVAAPSKGLRLLQRTVQEWRNRSCADQAAYIASLEEALRDADVDDSKKLRWIFRRAVAALSPPKLMNAAGNSEAALPETQETGADFQRRLRKVVLWCFEHLDLTDPRVKPALQLLQCLLEKFQELVSSEEGTVGGRRHWLRLQMKFGVSPVPATWDSEAKNEGRGRKRVLCQHNLRKDRCRNCQPCPHGNARFHCIHCSGCSHGHFKRNCAACNGCPHGKYTVSRCDAQAANMAS
eukprot:s285_g21.t4